MLKEVARKDDTYDTGHKCTTTGILLGITGDAFKVYANSLPVVGADEMTKPHTYEEFPACLLSHTPKVEEGSETVFVGPDLVPLSRVDDDTEDDAISSGSPDVFCGD